MTTLRTAFAIIVALFVLAGCASMMPGGDPLREDFRSPQLDDADAAIALDDFVSAVTLLRMAANQTSGSVATELELEAAVLALTVEDTAVAQTLLDTNRWGSDDRITALRDLLETRLNTGLDPAAQTQQLAALGGLLSPRTEPWRLQWLSQAHLAAGEPFAAAQAMFEATGASNSAAMQRRVEAQLWQALMQVPVEQLAQQRDRLADGHERAWMDFALGVKARLLDPNAMRAYLVQTQWQGPLASSLLRERIAAVQRALLSPPRAVAALLPLSGDLQTAGEAIQRGILAAHYATPAPERPELRFIDVGSAGMDPVNAYRRAVADGAGMVIGPLSKPAVNQLLTTTAPAVPIIALNRAEAPAKRSDFYQFGLAPEEDARAIAALAIELGHDRLLTFGAADSWGGRVAKAFATAFESAGGEVVAQARFPLEQEDLAEPIRALLDLDRSDERSERLRSITGERFRHEPRRRQDIDGVFIAAFEESARLIIPQLRFHRGFDLPVYGTSQSYPVFESEVANADLAGMWITRLPWLLGQLDEPLDRAIALQLDDAFPERRHGPLTALGIDSYRLLYSIQALALNPALQQTAATGRLSVDTAGHVQRQLPAAQVTSRGLRRTNNWLP